MTYPSGRPTKDEKKHWVDTRDTPSSGTPLPLDEHVTPVALSPQDDAPQDDVQATVTSTGPPVGVAAAEDQEHVDYGKADDDKCEQEQKAEAPIASERSQHSPLTRSADGTLYKASPPGIGPPPMPTVIEEASVSSSYQSPPGRQVEAEGEAATIETDVKIKKLI